jgi:diguanylate cyclase (GGDEF)-like protein
LPNPATKPLAGHPALFALRQDCLVILSGPGIGRKIDLPPGALTIGRDAANDLVITSDQVSRNHARIELEGPERWLVDLGSTNGTALNDKRITRARLTTGDLLHVGVSILKYLSGDDLEAVYYEELYRMAATDGLTSIANKRALDEGMAREIARCRRHDRSLAVMLIDVDHFKRVNDTLGHVAGDLLLRDLALCLKARMRRDELLARFGGEEFAVLLPESTLEEARQYAEILRQRVEAQSFDLDGVPVSITVSIGVAVLTPNMEEPADLVREADRRLYLAKERGRNLVVAQ